MKRYIIVSIRAISCVLIPLLTFAALVTAFRLQTPGSGVTHRVVLLYIILLLIPVAIVMLLHYETKEKQFVNDLKKVGALVCLILVPIMIFLFFMFLMASG